MKQQFKMANVQPEQVRPREDAEHDRQHAVSGNAMARRRKNRTKAVLYRCTQTRKDQLDRLAVALSVGRQEDPVSLVETINRALDALDEKLRGTKG